MLPFFRKIRKKLADDNQFFKYSRYAIGEIVLVVIGILIALYINDWNDKRIATNLVELSLKDLVLEIQNNQNLLSHSEVSVLGSIRSMNILLDHTQLNPKRQLDSLDWHMVNFIYSPKYIPVEDVFNSILNSTTFDHIQSKELKYSLTKLNGTHDEYGYWADMNSTIVIEQILPFLYKNYNLANYGIIEVFRPLKRSGFDFNQNELLGSREFENLLIQRRISAIQVRTYINRLQALQSKILDMINAELQ